MPYSVSWSSHVSVQGTTVQWDENAQATAVNIINLPVADGGAETLNLQAAPAEPNILFLLRSSIYTGLTVAVGPGAAMPFDGPAIINRMALKLLGQNGIAQITVANASGQEAWIDVAVFREA